MDLTRGSVLKNLILFAIPIFFTGLLQQLYHAADVVVVGNFAQDSKTALAAVGSTGAITNLIINLFVGLSIGANVVCANLCGARKYEELSKAMHTSIVAAFFSGILVAVLGVVFARPMLEMVGSPDTVIDQATLYMKIIFLGQPANLLYSFGAGILRAYGDTKRPMYILSATGVINVVLNLIFVAIFHLDAAGVAIATIVAQYVSASVVLFLLFHPAGEQKLQIFKLKIHGDMLKQLIRIGVPSGLNGMVFSISNVIIMSSVNSFGDVTVAGNSTSSNLEQIVWQVVVAFFTASVSFAGQNYGARNLKRIHRLWVSSTLLSLAFLAVVDLLIVLYPQIFLGLFTQDPDVIAVGARRLPVMCLGYLLFTPGEMSIACMRGMGRTTLPMCLNVIFTVITRIIWCLLFFPLNRTYGFLLLCYPISWTLATIAQTVFFFLTYHKEKKRIDAEREAVSAN